MLPPSLAGEGWGADRGRFFILQFLPQIMHEGFSDNLKSTENLTIPIIESVKYLETGTVSRSNEQKSALSLIFRKGVILETPLS